MNDNEFIEELKKAIRPDDDPVLISKETLEDAIKLMKPKRVIDVIEEVKDEFCRDFCKKAEECEANLKSGEELIYCPLDKL